MTAKRNRAWRIPASLFVACLALYHLNGRPIAEVDCYVAPYAAWSLVKRASFDVSDHRVLARYLESGAVLEVDDGRWLSQKPPGSSIAALPFVAPLALLRERPLERSSMTRLGKWVASAYVAGTAVLIYLLVATLAPTATAPTVVLVAAGTCLYSVASQALWTHGPATFFTCLGLYALLVEAPDPWRWRAPLAGFALCMAILSRPSTGLFALASVAALVWAGRPRAAAIAGALAEFFACLLLFYNQHYFQSPLSGGYGTAALAFTTPLSIGLPGLLVAPSRGLLFYTPALVLLPFGVARVIHHGARLSPQRRAVLLGWLGAAAATVLLYASREDWWGGWSFGPRYLCEATPILALFFAFSVEALRERFGRRAQGAAWALVALSAAIHLVGVFGHDSEWNRRHPRGSGLWNVADTQIEAHARHGLGLVDTSGTSPAR